MNIEQWLTISTTIAGIFALPALALVIRLTVRWTRIEDKQNQLLKDITTLIKDKDETHREIMSVVKENRSNADSRLRWLEEHLWRQGSLSKRYHSVAGLLCPGGRMIVDRNKQGETK
jgi:hypothetical protein